MSADELANNLRFIAPDNPAILLSGALYWMTCYAKTRSQRFAAYVDHYLRALAELPPQAGLGGELRAISDALRDDWLQMSRSAI